MGSPADTSDLDTSANSDVSGPRIRFRQTAVLVDVRAARKMKLPKSRARSRTRPMSWPPRCRCARPLGALAFWAVAAWTLTERRPVYAGPVGRAHVGFQQLRLEQFEAAADDGDTAKDRTAHKHSASASLLPPRPCLARAPDPVPSPLCSLLPCLSLPPSSAPLSLLPNTTRLQHSPQHGLLGAVQIAAV